MAEKWQRIHAKNGGTLYGKTFIPFEKEGDMGDAIMTNVTQQQHKFLAETKQLIVHNLNNVDEIIEISLGEDVDMDPAGITLRDIFFTYHDKNGNRLIDAIEKTSTGGTYRFLFQQNKTEEAYRRDFDVHRRLGRVSYALPLSTLDSNKRSGTNTTYHTASILG
jgi:hypothetical protein